MIAGARRVQASSLCDKNTIPAIVREVSDQQAMVMTLVENLQREDLNNIEQARSYHRLAQEFGLTQDEVAKRTGKDRSTMANVSAPAAAARGGAEAAGDRDMLTMGHAKVLMTIRSRC